MAQRNTPLPRPHHIHAFVGVKLNTDIFGALCRFVGRIYRHICATIGDGLYYLVLCSLVPRHPRPGEGEGVWGQRLT